MAAIKKPGVKKKNRPAPKGAQALPEELSILNSETRTELDRQYGLVPFIGDPGQRRWYDLPYRAIGALTFSAPWRHRVSPRIRGWANTWMNLLMAFNDLERSRIAHAGDPLHHVSVPEGELVSLPAFSLIDFYAPSHIPTLRRRLGRTRWNRDYTNPFDSPDVSLTHGRELEDYAAWGELARFYNRSHRTEHHSMFGIRAALPDEITSATAHLYPLGTGLTAIVMEFHLSEASMTVLNDAASASHQPRLVWSKGRLQVRDRVDEAFRAVERARADIHNAARRWMSEEVPGIFAASAAAKHPAMDILLTEVHDPLAPDTEHADLNYLGAFGLLAVASHRFIVEDHEGMGLLEYRPKSDGPEEDAGWMLVGNRSTARQAVRTSYTPDNDLAGIVRAVSSSARGMLSRLGLFSLLELKQAELSRSRDTAHSLHSKMPVRGAKKLRKAALRDGLDLSSIIDAIDSITADQLRYDHPLPKVRGARQDPGEVHGDSNTTAWAQRQREWSQSLRQLDETQIRILGLAASLGASIDGIRSQRWGLTVAVLSFISSVLAVWFAYLALSVSGA